MNKLVQDWKNAQAELAKAKKLELALRKELLEMYPGELGTEHRIVDGLDLTITRGVTRKVVPEDLAVITSSLTDEEKDCIIMKPTLDARRYAKLPMGNLLQRAIEVKPSLPSIKWAEVDD